MGLFFNREKDKTDNISLAAVRKMSVDILMKKQTEIVMWNIRYNKLHNPPLSPPRDLTIRFIKKQLYNILLELELYRLGITGSPDEIIWRNQTLNASQSMIEKLRDGNVSIEDAVQYAIDNVDYSASKQLNKEMVESYLVALLKDKMNIIGHRYVLS